MGNDYLLITTVIFFFFFIIMMINFKIILSPVSIFVNIWIFVILFYSIDLFDRPEIKQSTFTLVYVSIFFYIVGYFLHSYKELKINKRNYIEKKTLKIENTTILIVLTIFSMIAIFPTFLYQFQNFLAGNSLDDNKHLLMNDELSLGVLYVYFGKPMRILLSMIAAVMLVSNKKNLVFISAVLILMFMDYVCTGSKNIFFTWGAYVLLLVFLKNTNTILIFLKNNIKTLILGLISILIILYSMSQKINFGKSVYYYLCGNLPFLDYSLKVMPIQYQEATLGFSTFNGLLRIPFVFLNSLGLNIYPNILNTADSYLIMMDDFIYLNSHTIFNAFTTIFFYFYLDFGLFGLVVCMAFFGYVSSKIYQKTIYKESTYQYLCYLFLMSFILNSIGKSILSSPSYGAALIYLLFILKPLLSKKITINK